MHLNEVLYVYSQEITTALQGEITTSLAQNSSDSITENATAGVATEEDPSQDQIEVGSEHSDTGWETDLEIEGV